MLGTIFVIAIIVLVFVNFGGQAAATVNFDRESRGEWKKKEEIWDKRERDRARQTDTYYSHEIKGVVPWFYSDGSLKQGPKTCRIYPKGQYRATSHGLDCNLNPARPDMKRPPRN